MNDQSDDRYISNDVSDNNISNKSLTDYIHIDQENNGNNQSAINGREVSYFLSSHWKEIRSILLLTYWKKH